jgi:hypothetical protein
MWLTHAECPRQILDRNESTKAEPLVAQIVSARATADIRPSITIIWMISGEGWKYRDRISACSSSPASTVTLTCLPFDHTVLKQLLIGDGKIGRGARDHVPDRHQIPRFAVDLLDKGEVFAPVGICAIPDERIGKVAHAAL